MNHSQLIEEEPFKFKSGHLKLFFNDYHIFLMIDSKNENIPIKIDLENIKATIINNNIKYIIKIQQRFKHKIEKDKYFDKEFILSKAFEDIPLDLNKKLLAIKNKYFNFSIIFEDENSNSNSKSKRIEFILEEYETIKTWINALNYLIKIKKINLIIFLK